MHGIGLRVPKTSQERDAALLAKDLMHGWQSLQRDVETVRAVAVADMERANASGKGLWQNPNEAMRETQLAYIMRCFALIDGLSQYLRGGGAWDRKHRQWAQKREDRAKKAGRMVHYPSAQTRRMMSFMHCYMGVKPSNARMAIEIYRHMLMHEGVLHGVLDSEDRIYSWYAAWELQPDEHLCIKQFDERFDNTFLINIGTLNLVEDVRKAIVTYTDDLRMHESFYHAYLRLTAERWEDKLTWTPRMQFTLASTPESNCAGEG